MTPRWYRRRHATAVADLDSRPRRRPDAPTAYDAVAQSVDAAQLNAEAVAKPVYDDLS